MGNSISELSAAGGRFPLLIDSRTCPEHGETNRHHKDYRDPVRRIPRENERTTAVCHKRII